MRMNASWFLVAIPVVAISLAASVQTPSPAADIDAIRRLYEGFAAADKAGDSGHQTSFIAEDAIFMPPGAPTFVGRPAILKRWSDRARVEITDEFKISLDEIVVAGEWAFTRGTCLWRGHRPGETIALQERCRRLDVLRRQPDGSWLIARHIRNSSERPIGPGSVPTAPQ